MINATIITKKFAQNIVRIQEISLKKFLVNKGETAYGKYSNFK
jgi:hypothetical protein